MTGRKSLRLLLGILLMGVLVPAGAFASVPRVVLAENMGTVG